MKPVRSMNRTAACCCTGLARKSGVAASSSAITGEWKRRNAARAASSCRSVRWSSHRRARTQSIAGSTTAASGTVMLQPIALHEGKTVSAIHRKATSETSRSPMPMRRSAINRTVTTGRTRATAASTRRVAVERTRPSPVTRCPTAVASTSTPAAPGRRASRTCRSCRWLSRRRGGCDRGGGVPALRRAARRRR